MFRAYCLKIDLIYPTTFGRESFPLLHENVSRSGGFIGRQTPVATEGDEVKTDLAAVALQSRRCNETMEGSPPKTQVAKTATWGARPKFAFAEDTVVMCFLRFSRQEKPRLRIRATRMGPTDRGKWFNRRSGRCAGWQKRRMVNGLGQTLDARVTKPGGGPKLENEDFRAARPGQDRFSKK